MISLALRCAQQGLTVEVMGHDLVAKLEGHVTRCFAYPFEVADIEPRLQEYGMALLQDHYEQGERGKRRRRAMQSDVDLLTCIAALVAEVATRASRAGQKAQGREITAQINSRFQAKGQAVRFCAVHQAKELEAWRVALLGAEEIMEAGRQNEEKGDKSNRLCRPDAVQGAAVTGQLLPRCERSASMSDEAQERWSVDVRNLHAFYTKSK